MSLLSHPVNNFEKSSLAFKFFLFWVFISIGRPQSIFPFMATLHLGDIAAIGTLISFLCIQPNQKNKNIFKYTEVKLVIVIFILMIVLIPFALVKTVSFNFIKDIFWKTLFFFMCSVILIRTIKDLKNTSMLLVVCMVSLSIATFLARGESIDRLSVGTMYDPNDLAMVIVTILPIAMMYGFHSKGIERMFGIGASLMGVLVIILTQSRGGFVGLIIIASMIFFSKSRFKIKYLIILLLFSVVFIRFAPKEYTDRIGTIGGDDGGSGRTLVWKRSLRIISSNPFGYGVNNFPSAYGQYVLNDPNAEADSGGYMTYAWRTAHNSFILIAVELGVLGLAVYVYLIYRVYNNFRRIKKTFTSDTILYQYAEFLRISLVGFLVCGFFLSQSYSYIFFLLVAISSVMTNVIVKNQISAVKTMSLK